MRKITLSILFLSWCGISSAVDIGKNSKAIEFIELSGFADGQAGNLSNASDDFNPRVNLGLTMNAFGKLGQDDSELKYGFKTTVIAGSNAINDEQGGNINEAFIYTNSKLSGKTQIGIGRTSIENMRVDASTFAAGSGGIDGDWFRFANIPTNGVFVLKPKSLTQTGFGYGATDNSQAMQQPRLGQGDDAFNLSFYSNRRKGLKFAASYVPNFKDRYANLGRTTTSGVGNVSFDGSGYFLKNGLMAVVNYLYQKDNFTFVSSVGAESAEVDYGQTTVSTIFLKPMRAIQTGFNLGYGGFTLGAGYHYYGQSLYSKVDAGSGYLKNSFSDQFNLGAGYSFDRYDMSVGFLQSRFAKNVMRVGVASLSARIAGDKHNNIRQYVEYSSYQFNALDSTGYTSKSSGQTIAIGFRGSFE